MVGADFDHVELPNVPRIVGARQWCGRTYRSAYAGGDTRDLLPCRIQNEAAASAQRLTPRRRAGTQREGEKLAERDARIRS